MQPELIETPFGLMIGQVIQLAIEKAKEKNKEVYFLFNGISITANPASYAVDLGVIYFYKHQLNRLTEGKTRV